MATLLKYKKGLKRPTLAWNEMSFVTIIIIIIIIVIIIIIIIIITITTTIKKKIMMMMMMMMIIIIIIIVIIIVIIKKNNDNERISRLVCWLRNVPATCKCISGTDLHRQFYVLPHWDRSCRSYFPPHPVTVYWHRADQPQHWPCNARRLAVDIATGLPIFKSLVWLDPEKSRLKRDSNPGSSDSKADALTTRSAKRSPSEVVSSVESCQ